MTEIEFMVECFRRAVHGGIEEPQIVRQQSENELLEIWVGNEERCLRLVFDASLGRIDETETRDIVWGLTVLSGDKMIGPADWRLIEAVLLDDRFAAIKQHKLVFGSTTSAARAEIDEWIAEFQVIGRELFVEKLEAILENKNLEIVDPGGLRRMRIEARLYGQPGEDSEAMDGLG